MRQAPMPPPDPSRVPDLLGQAIEAQRQGDERGLARATAEIMRNASPAQYVTFMRASEEYPHDMAKVREVMRAAVRINAEMPPESRITPPPAARAAAATARSTTVAPGTAPAPGPDAARTTPSPAPAPKRAHGQ